MDKKIRIREIIGRIIGEVFDSNKVNDDDDLLLFGLDSMGAVSLMVQIEDEYNIEIPDEDIDINKFNTINKIIEFISKTSSNYEPRLTSDAYEKIAIVTGANRGIGKGIARKLYKHGYHVISLSRHSISEDWCEEIVCDLTNKSDIEEAINCITKKYSHINVLVNNAGTRYFDRVDRIDSESWEEALSVNLTAPLLLQKGLIKQLVKANGNVLYIGSSAAENYFEGGASYSSSKLALKALSESSILDLRYEGIKFTYISTGATTIENYEENWKITPSDIGEVILNVCELPDRVMMPYIDIRPSKPLRSTNKGLDRLQYI